jgi:1-acyl-sn-glycerol-3-phosphate acyltransferase
MLSENVQPGIGFMAAKSKSPVVPVFINGTHKAFGRHARFIRPTKVKIYFGKPIYPVRPMRPTEKNEERSNGVYPENDKGKFDYEEFANRIMREIKQLSQERG